jgi:1-acyl-sn-glycerol-3-phosphate acyltransferase
MIAPEGTRSHTPGMQQANPGIAYLVDLSEVPVLPVGIVGSTYDFRIKAVRGGRPVLKMRIGSPFKLPTIKGRGLARREMRQQNADLVMKHLSALLPIEYQGVYSDCSLPLIG